MNQERSKLLGIAMQQTAAMTTRTIKLKPSGIPGNNEYTICRQCCGLVLGPGAWQVHEDCLCACDEPVTHGPRNA